MPWPKKIRTREMLTKETHAAEKFPTSPNTFLMVRFKCCFSMNIITVTQFVLKVFFNSSLSTVGTDHQKTYRSVRGGSTKKNIRVREN